MPAKSLSHALYQAVYPRLPIAVQNLACTAGGWWRFRTRFTEHFRRTLERWERDRKASVDELHEIQRQRLDRLVGLAREHVPYYRDLEPAARGSDPWDAIQKTLSRIPVLEKRAYRDQPTAFLSRHMRHRHLYASQTSGTTGTALPLWHSPETLAEEYATVWRMRRCLGVGIRDPHLSFNGQIVVPIEQQAPPFWRYNHYNGQALFSIYHMTDEKLRDYVDGVHSVDARFAQGYPSSIHQVARALLDAGRPLPTGRLAAVFTSSETLLAFQREAIEKAFAAPIFDRYGVSEFAVSMTQCEAGRLHVDMEFCIVEMEVVEESDAYETGPLLITGLAQDATPLFRYRIGDVGTRAKTPCPCGRPGDNFLEVDGRVEDYVLTPSGRRVGRMDHVFKEQLEVAEAQILQRDQSRIDVLIVPRSGFSEASERAVIRQIRQRLGPDIGIRIELVNNIPRERNGKFRAVKSVVGRNAP